MSEWRKVHSKGSPPSIVTCPYCGNNTKHEIGFWNEAADGHWLAVLTYSTCGEHSVYRSHWNDVLGRWTAMLFYPVPSLAPLEVPQYIQELFSEAISIRLQSPSLCAVGLRKCLEAVAKDQGAKGTLAQAINELATRSVVPPTMAKMMDSSRLMGNLGAHPTDAKLTSTDIDLLVDFALAVFEYVYVAPKKIAAVQRRLETFKATPP